MKLKSVVAAVAVALGASGAMAATTPLGPIGFSLIGGQVSAGMSLIGYSFSLASASDVFGGVSSFTPGVFTGVTISDNSMTWLDSNAANGFSFSGLSAGNYTLTVSVFSPTAASVGGYVQATPVPEPETYAMMLAGLVAVGFLARRRQG